jgi:hypothetical protein
MFFNGWSIDDVTETFKKVAKLIFKRRKVLNIRFFSRIQGFATGAIHSHRIKIGSVSKFLLTGQLFRRRQAAVGLLSRS